MSDGEMEPEVCRRGDWGGGEGGSERRSVGKGGGRLSSDTF